MRKVIMGGARAEKPRGDWGGSHDSRTSARAFEASPLSTDKTDKHRLGLSKNSGRDDMIENPFGGPHTSSSMARQARKEI